MLSPLLPGIDDEPGSAGRSTLEIIKSSESTAVRITVPHLALERRDETFDESTSTS